MNTNQETSAVSRRSLLAGSAALVATALPGGVFAAVASAAAPATTFAYVGCFTTAARMARGDGINVYGIDGGSGQWRHVQKLGGLDNPSFLLMARDGRTLYSVHGDLDYATAYAVDPADGTLRILGRAATGGRNGVHLAIDPSGRWLVMANYASGSVAVLEIKPDGSLVDQHQVVPLDGKPGTHRTEQVSSHPHNIVFDPSGRFVVVPDKGLDRVFVFRFDSQQGRLTLASSVASRPGAGPRHVVFHPSLPIAWVNDELDSTVATYRWDAAAGTLTPLQVQTTLPTNFFGDSATAEIALSPDNRFVLCSNRGGDTVTTFAIGATDGLLTLAGWTPTQGRDPRFIAFEPSGRQFVAANEQGDNIVAFTWADGRLVPTGQTIRNTSPVTIVFLGKA